MPAAHDLTIQKGAHNGKQASRWVRRHGDSMDIHSHGEWTNAADARKQARDMAKRLHQEKPPSAERRAKEAFLVKDGMDQADLDNMDDKELHANWNARGGSLQGEKQESTKPHPKLFFEGESEKAAIKLLGKPPDEEMVSAFSGAIHGGDTQVFSYDEHDGKGVSLITTAPDYESARNVAKDADGNLYVYNDSLVVNEDKQGKGIGLSILTHQVGESQKLGAKYLKTNAFGNKEKATREKEIKWSGYKVWPALGYDGPLLASHKSQLPKEFDGASTIQELYSMPGGKEAWEEHGSSIDLKFDLTPGSKGRRILAVIAKRKGMKFDA